MLEKDPGSLKMLFLTIFDAFSYEKNTISHEKKYIKVK
jgi:hypothetical protein